MSPGAPVRSGRAWKTNNILHPSGFDSRASQPVANGKQFKATWLCLPILYSVFYVSAAVCWRHSNSFLRGDGVGWGWLYAQNQPFKTEFPLIITLQLFRNFSAQIALSNFFSWWCNFPRTYELIHNKIKHFDKRLDIISIYVNSSFTNSVLHRLAEVVWYSHVV